jgi:drug/metabolite transporter (DMT)-like permease
VDIDIGLDYGLTLLAALLIGTGFVLQQQTAQLEPASRFLSLRLILDLLRQPRWLAGIACMIGGQVLAAWSIGHLSLAFVEPLLTTNLVFALVLAVPIAKATLRFWEIFGAVVLCTGVALLSAARSAKPIGLSFGSFSHWPAAAVIAVIAAVAVHYGHRNPGRLRATLTGTGAGLVFGIQDALTRQTLQILGSDGISAMFTSWAPYALVGAGATGIWLMQSAFSAGPLPLSLPAISAGEPLIGILLGVLIFGDRIQVSPGELALQAGGIVALVAGVILVGRAPALSQLRGPQLRNWTPPGLPHITGGLPLPILPGIHGRHPGEYGPPDTSAGDHRTDVPRHDVPRHDEYRHDEYRHGEYRDGEYRDGDDVPRHDVPRLGEHRHGEYRDGEYRDGEYRDGDDVPRLGEYRDGDDVPRLGEYRHSEYRDQGHGNGVGRLNGHAPADPPRAPDNEIADEPAEPPKPLRRSTGLPLAGSVVRVCGQAAFSHDRKHCLTCGTETSIHDSGRLFPMADSGLTLVKQGRLDGS